MTIFSPGTPMNQDAGIWEWIAPNRPPAPTTERITSGTLICSPLRNQYLLDWLTRLSIASVRKSPNMISITGRSPEIAAPNAAPVSASSEIGVSKTRSRPYFSYSPGVTANTPPASATSSPKKMTRSSAASSSSSASRRAVRKSIVVISSLLESIDRGRGQADARAAAADARGTVRRRRRRWRGGRPSG